MYYTITDAVYRCYVEYGVNKEIKRDVLARRLSANVCCAVRRERIIEGQNKWRYYLGKFIMKVDHDKNEIYYIEWTDRWLPIPKWLLKEMKNKYKVYGLNTIGNDYAKVI